MSEGKNESEKICLLPPFRLLPPPSETNERPRGSPLEARTHLLHASACGTHGPHIYRQYHEIETH